MSRCNIAWRERKHNKWTGALKQTTGPRVARCTAQIVCPNVSREKNTFRVLGAGGTRTGLDADGPTRLRNPFPSNVLNVCQGRRGDSGFVDGIRWTRFGIFARSTRQIRADEICDVHETRRSDDVTVDSRVCARVRFVRGKLFAVGTLNHRSPKRYGSDGRGRTIPLLRYTRSSGSSSLPNEITLF